jgi:hypothetical protein
MSSEDFPEQPSKGKESYLEFKKRMYKLLASQPKDGISNVRGPIMDTIELPVIPFQDIPDFCNASLSRDEKAALTERPTYYILDKIGRLDVDAPPFAVDSEPFLVEGFRIHPKGEIIINPAETVESGDVAIVMLEGAVFLKRVAITPQGFELTSRSQPPVRVLGEYCLLDRFRILGKMMGELRPVQGMECH